MRIQRLLATLKSRVAPLSSTSTTASTLTASQSGSCVGREATNASAATCGAIKSPMYVQRARLRTSLRNTARAGSVLAFLTTLPSLNSHSWAAIALILGMSVCVIRILWILSAIKKG